MTELLGVATEKEMGAIITKGVFRLLKNNDNNSSETSENHSIQCQRHKGELPFQLTKTPLKLVSNYPLHIYWKH
jgi:hypothetical protein